MRKFVIAFLLSLTAVAGAQVSISASSVRDAFNAPYPSARLCFTPVDGTLTARGFRNGATQVIPVQRCGLVTAGVLQSGLTLVPTPVGIYYHITVVAAVSNLVLRDMGLTPITGSSWTLDTYDPSLSVIPVSTLTYGATATGAPGSGAYCTLAGTAPNYVLNCTVPQGATGATGPTGLSGSVSAAGAAGTVQTSNGAGGLGSVAAPVKVDGNGDVTTPTSVLHNGTAPLDVMSPACGAVGDGVTDDSTAIQACVTYAEAHGFHVIKFPTPSLCYKVTKSINMTGVTNLWLVGDGKSSGFPSPTVYGSSTVCHALTEAYPVIDLTNGYLSGIIGLNIVPLGGNYSNSLATAAVYDGMTTSNQSDNKILYSTLEAGNTATSGSVVIYGSDQWAFIGDDIESNLGVALGVGNLQTTATSVTSKFVSGSIVPNITYATITNTTIVNNGTVAPLQLIASTAGWYLSGGNYILTEGSSPDIIQIYSSSGGKISETRTESHASSSVAQCAVHFVDGTALGWDIDGSNAFTTTANTGSYSVCGSSLYSSKVHLSNQCLGVGVGGFLHFTDNVVADDFLLDAGGCALGHFGVLAGAYNGDLHIVSAEGSDSAATIMTDLGAGRYNSTVCSGATCLSTPDLVPAQHGTLAFTTPTFTALPSTSFPFMTVRPSAGGTPVTGSGQYGVTAFTCSVNPTIQIMDITTSTSLGSVTPTATGHTSFTVAGSWSANDYIGMEVTSGTCTAFQASMSLAY